MTTNHAMRASLGFVAASLGASLIGALTMRGKGSPKGAWYRTLRKPSYQPPSWVFGPVWTVLYGAIAYAGYRTWRMARSPARTRALALWGAQMALNAAWTPLFFGARRPRAALADMFALDAAVLGHVGVTARRAPRAAVAMAPYLAWLGFATALNAAIVAKNR
jgi:benzodiazapine receptor